MQCVWALAVFLLAVGCQAQSGDTDTESRISCSSHIMIARSSLTCKLVGGGSEDDEDEEDDSIEGMTVCYTDLHCKKRCFEGLGDTVTSEDLTPLVNFSVTIQLKRGGTIKTTVNLKNIVKPRSPSVSNVSFSSHQAVFSIQTPYQKEILKVENQLFQLAIWSKSHNTTQNVSSSDTLKINMEHLQMNTQYHVRVRAIPMEHLQGSWSEWSKTFTFYTPAGEKVSEEMYTRIVCPVVLLVVTCCALLFFWKNKILTYMWPSIPHPKETLVQICRPTKGLLLNFKPEEFSSLKVSPMERSEKQPFEETERSVPAAAEESSPSSSTHTSDCSSTSVNTEELELSALLSRSCSDGEDSLQSNAPSPIHILQAGQGPPPTQPEAGNGEHQVEVFAVSQRDEAYVTMSSFHQIK